MAPEETRLSEADFRRLKREMSDVVRAEVPSVLTEVFEKLNIDISTAEARGKFRDKMVFLGNFMETSQTMKRGAARRIGDAIAGGIIAGLAAFFGLSFWGGKPPLH